MQAESPDRRAERWGLWVANLLAVTLLPLALGRTWHAPPAFILYVGITAPALLLAEDGHGWHKLLTRRDVRAYLRVRVVLVALGALPPFVLGAICLD